MTPLQRAARTAARAFPPSLLAGLGLMLAAAAPVSAGGYTVYSCRGPLGLPISAQAWEHDPGAPGTSDACDAGGSLTARLDGQGKSPASLTGYRFALPRGAVVARYRISLTARTAKARAPEAIQAGLGVGSILSLPPVVGGCTQAGCVFGDTTDPLADSALLTEGRLPTGAGLPGGLALVARCDPGPDCSANDDEDSDVALVRLWRSAVDLLDDSPPQLGAPGGSLLGPGAASGHASVALTATDAGGGVADVTLRIDGTEVARRDAGGTCVEPYSVPVPCPATLPVAFEVDTRTLSGGPHVAELLARDAAGSQTSSGELAFTVDNAGPPPPPAPAASPPPPVVERIYVPVVPAIAAVRVDRRRVTLPARGASVAGVVRRADGAPAAGARLVVRSRRFGAGAPRPSDERTLSTDAAGRFSFPAGTTPRRLIVTLDDPGYRYAESDEVALYGRLSLGIKRLGKRLRNGSQMTLVAAIGGAGARAADGRLVLIQALVGSRWATVDSVVAQPSGKATWRYRFRRTRRTAVYRFRVQVRAPRAGGDWPWPTTTSAVVKARVRP